MLVAEDFYSWNARENKAIARLCSVLDEVVATGRPSPIECYPTSLTNREFVKIAVGLCTRAEVNVAVLGNPVSNQVTLVPLRDATAGPRPSVSAGRAFGPLAAAGTLNNVVI
jgi:hypothetical protein